MQQKERLVSIPKRDLESLEATLETIESRKVVKQLIDSNKDIAKGKIKRARDFLKKLG
ncbi:MAG: hypothetical protein ACREBF_04730 [Candidatus Micrarchaeales archaeon]